MYLKHFGFEELPFSVTPDPQFFYATPVYQDVLAGLQHGIATKGAFIVVTGEAGTGKTTLLRRLIHDSPRNIDYAFVNIRPRSSLPALLRAILKDLKVSTSSMEQQDLLDELSSYVLERFKKRRTVAFLFDESQGLDDELLLELPILWNVAIQSEKIVPIVLMGQPELDKRFNSPKLRQLAQHITLRRRLVPFPDDDVGPYIETRLEHVGYRGKELFEPAAIETLVSRSNGIPRVINSICDNALLCAYRASQHKVTAAMIDEIANQLRLVERSDRAKPADEVADLFRFIERRSSADKKRTDEAVNQPRFVEALLSAGENKADDVVGQPRFVEGSPDPAQEEIHEAAGAARFVDNPAANVNQKEHGEISQQPRFVDHISNAEEKRIDDDIHPLPFINHSAKEDRKVIPELEQQQNSEKSFSAKSLDSANTVDDLTPFPTLAAKSTDAAAAPPIKNKNQLTPSGPGHSLNSEERLSPEFIETSGRNENLAKDETDQLAPSRVDRPQNLARHFPISAADAGDTAGFLARKVADQPAPSEIEQPRKLEKSFSDFETNKAANDTAKKGSEHLIPPIYQGQSIHRLNYQLGKTNPVRISIGALIILVVIAAGLAVFYPRQRDAAGPGKRYVENLSRETSKTDVPAMPVDDVKNIAEVSDQKMVEEPPQAVVVAPPPSLDVPERSDQNRDTAKKPNLVEGGNIGKETPASQDIYRVKGPSFLRKRPTANAEIIETLHPGMRIVVTNRSGEYLSVRSSDGKISGFVHKEDAFFERIRQ